MFILITMKQHRYNLIQSDKRCFYVQYLIQTETLKSNGPWNALISPITEQLKDERPT